MFYAALRVLYIASLVAGASATGFADRAALKAAVDNCLAANPTGNCDCSSASVNCGVAGDRPMSEWDTSLVSDMNRLFRGKEYFDADISAWDVRGVTDMSRMFSSAKRFSQDISAWNVVNVVKMETMFSDCQAFNAPIGSWNTDGVTDVPQRNSFQSTDRKLEHGTGDDHAGCVHICP